MNNVCGAPCSWKVVIPHCSADSVAQCHTIYKGGGYSLCDQGDVGIAGEPGAVVVPAGEGLVAASPGQPMRGMAWRWRPVQQGGKQCG